MRYGLRFLAAGATLSIAALGAGALTSHPLAASAAEQAPTTAASHASGHSAVLRASLAPSLPADAPIFGAVAGGVPWSLEHGDVRLNRNGGLDVDVDGLIVTSLGSNPVPGLAASVYCNGTRVATTAPVPFSSKGDAQIDATVTLPAFCAAPAVLLNPAVGNPTAARPGVYIGFDGTK